MADKARNRNYDRRPFLQCRIDDETWTQVRSYADREKVSMAEATRQLVEFGLEQVGD